MENISLTQRIVGAIVILSLAIIFIPALLETDRLDPGKATDSPIPEVPREISTIVFQLNEKNGKFEGEGLNGEKLTASEQLTREVTQAMANSENEVMIEPEASTETVPETSSGKGTSPAKTPPLSKQTATEQAKKPSIFIDDGKQHTWMLQLASFKDENNAIKLRNTLRDKQYVTHVSERKFSSGSIWRVRIGPVLSKNKIVKIQALLEKEMGMKGLIVRRR